MHTGDITAALMNLLLVQTDKSLFELREMGSAELKSFKQSLLKNRGLTLKVVTTCLEACAILEIESGKTKAEKVDYIFENLI